MEEKLDSVLTEFEVEVQRLKRKVEYISDKIKYYESRLKEQHAEICFKYCVPELINGFTYYIMWAKDIDGDFGLFAYNTTEKYKIRIEDLNFEYKTKLFPFIIPFIEEFKKMIQKQIELLIEEYGEKA
jgi:hypothetical protein